MTAQTKSRVFMRVNRSSRRRGAARRRDGTALALRGVRSSKWHEDPPGSLLPRLLGTVRLVRCRHGLADIATGNAGRARGRCGSGADAAEGEKVVVKLRAGLMPPSGVRRPSEAVIDDFTSSLESALDRAAMADPHPGPTP